MWAMTSCWWPWRWWSWRNSRIPSWYNSVNGWHNNKLYYRSRCNACIRKGKKLKPQKPRWQTSGYKKKTACDRCGFKSRHSSQLLVYHVDGDLNNTELRNLKTICLNCAAEITRSDLPWKPGDLEPDY
jgi:hypothetical protein